MKCFTLQGEWQPKSSYVPSEREKRDAGRTMDASLTFKNMVAQIEERPIPQIKADEVLIRMGACGICGTDVHVIESSADGYSRYASHLRLPVVLGHEFSGEVVKVGDDVTEVKVGDLIAVEQIRWCGKCHSCRIGMFNQCESMEEVGLSMDGGFAEYVVVPEKYCCVINRLAELYGSKGAALEAGALVEPTAVAYSGIVVNGGGIKPGSHVVVYGAGAIGLVSVALAKACGAAKIFCIANTDSKLALAKQMGADVVINARQLPAGTSVADVVLAETDGLGAGVVVEAAAAYSDIYPQIEAMLAVGGKVIELGISPEPAPLHMPIFLRKNAGVQGSLGHAGSDIFPSVIRLMEAGRIDVRPLVTGRFPLEKTADAIAAAAASGLGKVMVVNYQED